MKVVWGPEICRIVENPLVKTMGKQMETGCIKGFEGKCCIGP